MRIIIFQQQAYDFTVPATFRLVALGGVEGDVSGPTISAGGRPSSFTSASGTNLSMDDGLVYINAYVFNGAFSNISASTGIGTQLSPYGEMAMGGACSDTKGLGADTDVWSASIMNGTARVKKVTVEECCEK
ncbi:hypothetical protein [Undibacterium pigrum]|uniref:Uncharacterized protein n=1 Tax=Undibacterium pigrum TaxID=401470 RepID=A0A318J8M5_9BURK|nr:hypothetical protein [Undibacterium pigrum]PXX44231.1 hypothetical protein DFR42_103500 [Undibacterium pigrum]